jgi:hypothetical protein
MFDTCSCLSMLLEPFGDLPHVGARRCYLEIFFEKCLVLFCGSTDQEKAKRVVHRHTEKLQLLNGIFATPDVYAAIYITIDVWEQNYQSFHAFARSPAAYGGFAPPFLRHMMAERAATDVVWYRAARADPRTHLPKLHSFISSSRFRDHIEQMTAEVRTALKGRADKFLEAAEAKCLKWNGSSKSWLRARFLFGTLLNESRRRWFAADLLCAMGLEDRLDERLQQPDVNVQQSAGSRRTVAPVARPQPATDVDKELQARLREAQQNGTLSAEIKLWKLDTEAVVCELLGLAAVREASAAELAEAGPTLDDECTPTLYKRCAPALLLPDFLNLRLNESACFVHMCGGDACPPTAGSPGVTRPIPSPRVLG